MAAVVPVPAASAALAALRLYPNPNPPSLANLHCHRSRRKLSSIGNCTLNPNPNPTTSSNFDSNSEASELESNSKPSDLPSDGDAQELSPNIPLEKRWPSVIDHRRGTSIQWPDPPNYQIGWKRTKEINHEKPKGFVIADFLEKLETLMGRQYGSADLLAKVGEIVAERAREEAEVLRAGGEVEERLITELYRVLRLMEMDLAMVRAAVKDETLAERIEQAKARCRQAILVALSF